MFSELHELWQIFLIIHEITFMTRNGVYDNTDNYDEISLWPHFDQTHSSNDQTECTRHTAQPPWRIGKNHTTACDGHAPLSKGKHHPLPTHSHHNASPIITVPLPFSCTSTYHIIVVVFSLSWKCLHMKCKGQWRRSADLAKYLWPRAVCILSTSIYIKVSMEYFHFFTKEKLMSNL